MGKIKELNEKYSKIYLDNLVEKIIDGDKTKTKKYSDWVLKTLTEDVSEYRRRIFNSSEGLYDILEKFEQHCQENRIKNKDIYTYPNIKEVLYSNDEAEYLLMTKEQEKKSIILFEDDEWVVLKPMSYMSSKIYGRGTKWCTTDTDTFYSYSKRGILIYLINKQKDLKYGIFCLLENNSRKLRSVVTDEISKSEDPRITKYKSNELARNFSCWDGLDNRVEIMFLNLPERIIQAIKNEISHQDIPNFQYFDDVEVASCKYFYTPKHRRKGLRYSEVEYPDDPTTIGHIDETDMADIELMDQINPLQPEE